MIQIVLENPVLAVLLVLAAILVFIPARHDPAIRWKERNERKKETRK